MSAADDSYGGIINRGGLPSILLGLGVLLVLVSFAVGWFSIDAVLHRYAYDESAPNNAGAEQGVIRLDLEMHMLKIETRANPLQLEENIRERGEPTYDDHAGRMGTVMLGVLMLQFVVLLALLATAGFYYLHRRKRHDYAGVTKRLCTVFLVIAVLTLLYFALRIGPSARDDEQYILDRYDFLGDVPASPIEPEIGFWKTWKSFHTRVTIPDTGETEMWQIVVFSRPSAGFWLMAASVGCVLGARIVAGRNGEFSEAKRDEPLPALPKIASG
ncbi:MAG TPA: hypothetical protein VI818_00555 [Candidatus Thermoplasmatota archaeon]|nr:hypothetical protein [Candidatus Thermoplasmatota archaeon]